MLSVSVVVAVIVVTVVAMAVVVIVVVIVVGFSSTRSHGQASSFMDITIQGLAPDRGLYVSNADIPTMTKGQWQRLVGLSYTECALRILEQWISPTEISHKVRAVCGL